MSLTWLPFSSLMSAPPCLLSKPHPAIPLSHYNLRGCGGGDRVGPRKQEANVLFYAPLPAFRGTLDPILSPKPFLSLYRLQQRSQQVTHPARRVSLKSRWAHAREGIVWCARKRRFYDVLLLKLFPFLSDGTNNNEHSSGGCASTNKHMIHPLMNRIGSVCSNQNPASTVASSHCLENNNWNLDTADLFNKYPLNFLNNWKS